MAPALILALTLMASSSTPAPDGPGEPLPPGAPSEPYQLTGWCYGALAEYLEIYDVVKPDLVAIDKMFGTPVKEAEPYQSDVAAYRDELKIFANAIEATEKASPQVISPQGAQAIRAGQGIWRPAEARSRRELARAWLSWGMPDQCDTNARALLAKSTVLGKALSYNNGATSHSTAPAAPAAGQADADTNGGALTLAPIAPIVTQDAAAPKGSTLANAGTAPTSSRPAGAAPLISPPADQPPPAGDVVAAAPASRVLGEAAAPSEPPADSSPPPAAQAPTPAAPEPAPSSAPPAAIKQPSDQAQEPVL